MVVLDTVREHLFLLAHDEDKKLRPLIHPSTLGVGLAGAGIIDLLIDDRIHIDHGRAYVTNLYNRTRTGDPITDDVLTIVHAVQPAPPLPRLLRDLAGGLYERTQAGLVAAGVLIRVERRLRSHYALTQPMATVSIRAAVRSRLDGKTYQSVDYLIVDALCALISALGLQHSLMAFSTAREINEQLQQITARIANLSHGGPTGAIPLVSAMVREAVGDDATAVYR
jgi:hypothetical protein